MRILEEAARQRLRLAELAPRIAILCGPASPEDRVYFEATDEPSRSYHHLASSLTRLGAAQVRIIDITTTPAWLAEVDGCDVVVINLHGEPGEDGTIQGCLQLSGIRFLGSRCEASAIGLNKYLTKLMAISAGVPTPAYAIVRDGERIAGDAGLTRGDWIRKPMRGGSSMDVSRIAGWHDIPPRGEWMIEEFRPGHDVTVTVVELAGRPFALPAVELRHPGEIFDMDAKMRASAVAPAVAARPTELLGCLAECERLALRMHTALGARHLSRCDFMISNGSPYFLEINTIPGISAKSLAAECAQAAGLDYDDFMALLLGAAMADSRPCVSW
jgi:D-alanine-D-alanine ligase